MTPLKSPSASSEHATYTNGHNETLLSTSGVSSHTPAVQRTPTVFADDPPLRGLPAALYGLTRFELMGLAGIRFLTGIWLIIAAVGAVNMVPFAPLWLAAGIVVVVIQTVLVRHWQSRQFVSFRPQPSVLPEPDPLSPSDKLPVFVTGLCHVEGKYQRFTALPGFYRTFATGEHALLCQARDRTWYRVMRWPLDEIGMWYAFVTPSDITRLAWGEVDFGKTNYPGIAITYQLELPAGPRRKQPKRIEETIYIAAAPEHAQRIFADLMHQLPPVAIATANAYAR